MAQIPIGQLAKKADIAASTLRYYESVGLLPVPERMNGQRRYDDSLVDRISFIKVAQQTGFTIQEIALLLDGFQSTESITEQWERMAEQKRVELERRKNQIQSMIQILENGIQCKCLTWSECLDEINGKANQEN